MSDKRIRFLLLGMLGLSIVGFFALAALGLSVLSVKSEHMVELKLQDKVSETQLASLAQSKKDVQQYSYFKDVAKTVIPTDKDQAQTVLEIFQIAEQSGIGLQSITFPNSTLGAAGAATATSASSASAKSLISQAQPVSGIAGLYSISLTITPQTGSQLPPDRQVTYAKMLDFLKRIESNRRTAQITQVNIQPQGGSLVNFTLGINMFIKP